MAQYGKPEYWEERYTRDAEPFDWYQRWAGVKDVVTQYVLPTSQILHVGCGNSRMSEEMYDDGFINSINIDISQVVTKAMQEKYREKPTMRFLHMDGRNMEFDDGSFDAAIDKGTLDAVLCGENSTANAQKMLSEVYRVLSPTGVYILISYGQPQHRYPYIDKPEFNWEIIVHQVQKPTISTTAALATDDKDQPNVHYIFVCKKRGAKEGPGDHS
jgi:ubiquinone/menaquinone biosynthesis C-methylase UbiE